MHPTGLITSRQAYLAMFEFLRRYQERGPTDELGAMLGSLSLLADGNSADPAMISDWNDSVVAVLMAEESNGYHEANFRLQLVKSASMRGGRMDGESNASEAKRDQPADSLADLPQWQPRPEPVVAYKCQRCHEPHRYTRRYWLPTLIFFLFVFVWRWENYAYCPRCMRLHLVLYLVPNMLVATLAAPVVLIAWAWVFFKTFSRSPYAMDSEYEE